MATITDYIGKPTNRYDGRAKVTGQARYAAEYKAPDLAHGVAVSSAIAKGRITSIDASAALAVDGVIQVFTHENRPSLAWFDRSYQDEVAPPGSPFRPLYSDRILYSGQPVALVVAETFEVARYAASLVRVTYEREDHATDLEAQVDEAYVPRRKRSGYTPPPAPRGDADKAFETAATKHEAVYRTPVEHHNPMEPHASTVVWEGDGKITVYDKTQGPQNSQQYVVNVFGFSPDDVKVVNAYVGGAFGSGLRPQYQLFLAVMAARELKRSVRVALTRQQMFTFGYRPDTLQKVGVASDAEGKLQTLMHDAVGSTSRFEDYIENVVNWSGLLYPCENMKLTHRIAQVDRYTPFDMRAPGATLGVYAIEAAMDELAYKAGIDPLELRFRNYAERDPLEDKPFSSKALRECYRQGAERFGWAGRRFEPRSMRDGKELVGWGMANGAWEAQQQQTSARAILTRDGRLEVASATSDIGTGTYTMMAQIAAQTLGVPIEIVTVKLGDSTLPTSPVQGGSWTAASVGSAVQAVCQAVRAELFRLARRMNDSPLADARPDDVVFAEGEIRLRTDPSRAVAVAEVMRQNEMDSIEEETSAAPSKSQAKRYSQYTHSAIFAEVKVDEALGTIRVTRVVDAVAAGHIVNPKTARSQVLGGVVWGMGVALYEETLNDHLLGRFMNHNLAEYHVPVNADVHDIDVIFVEEHDEIVNPLGIKGLGEIGIVGTAAAIANAVYHATGVRVRDLPITLDKLLK